MVARRPEPSSTYPAHRARAFSRSPRTAAVAPCLSCASSPPSALALPSSPRPSLVPVLRRPLGSVGRRPWALAARSRSPSSTIGSSATRRTRRTPRLPLPPRSLCLSLSASLSLCLAASLASPPRSPRHLRPPHPTPPTYPPPSRYTCTGESSHQHLQGDARPVLGGAEDVVPGQAARREQPSHLYATGSAVRARACGSRAPADRCRRGPRAGISGVACL